jgi:hypothetical protein
MNDPAIDKLYETCRYHLFQIEHARADFRNEFRIKSNINKDISFEIEEEFKTMTADVYALAELLFNIINEETEENLIQIIRDRENNKDNKHVLV